MVEALPLLAHDVFAPADVVEGRELPPVIIAHGLYGSGRNWASIARKLAASGRRVILPDMRNHGRSFRHPVHDYPALADDLARLVDHAGGRADVVGHSMGGKAAMVLALRHPGKVRRLAVIDIAPVAYDRTRMPIIEALRAVDLDKVHRRRDAEALLAAHIDDPALRSFLLHALDLGGDRPRWRLDLDALAANMDVIMGFPSGDEIAGRSETAGMGDAPDVTAVPGAAEAVDASRTAGSSGTTGAPAATGARFAGPVLFLRGQRSDYVLSGHVPRIRHLFPRAIVATIKGAGHWLHAERPQETAEALTAFLGRMPLAAGDPATEE